MEQEDKQAVKEFTTSFAPDWDSSKPTAGIIWYSRSRRNNTDAFYHALQNISGARKVNNILFFVSHTGVSSPLDQRMHAFLYVTNTQTLFDAYDDLDEDQREMHYTMFSLHVPFSIDEITIDHLREVYEDRIE